MGEGLLPAGVLSWPGGSAARVSRERPNGGKESPVFRPADGGPDLCPINEGVRAACQKGRPAAEGRTRPIMDIGDVQKRLRPMSGGAPCSGTRCLGFAARATGAVELAAGLRIAATLPVLAALVAEIVLSLRRGDVGLDIVAAHRCRPRWSLASISPPPSWR